MRADELLACLVDRPCSACKFHTEQGCSKWSCVFEDKIEELPSAEHGVNADNLIKKIKQLEPLNNSDCPQWVINVIKGEIKGEKN